MQSLLTPFETYMLLDETPSHPMEFFYRLRFDGPLDPGSVKDAATRAVARHPLLGSRIEWGRAARPRFLPLEQRRIAAEIIQTATVAECESLPRIPPLDLSSGPLVRVVAVAGPQIDGSPSGPRELIAQFHHVACDGLGALAACAAGTGAGLAPGVVFCTIGPETGAAAGTVGPPPAATCAARQ